MTNSIINLGENMAGIHSYTYIPLDFLIPIAAVIAFIVALIKKNKKLLFISSLVFLVYLVIIIIAITAGMQLEK